MGLSCFKSWKHDRHKGNRDVLVSPGSYFFLSNSGGQGDEWLQSLNKDLWIPFTGVFGQRLEETVLYEQRYGVRLIPLLVEQCVNFLRDHGLQEVGLFRQPGRVSVVTELQEAFDSGERPSFKSSLDVHSVASLLKLYLCQLPEPLVPHTHFQDFLCCGDTLSLNRTKGLVQLKNLLHELPLVNFNLLHFLCQFFSDVHSFSNVNQSDVHFLAAEFQPNVLCPKAEELHSIMRGASPLQLLMEQLIIEHQKLFHRMESTGPLGLVQQKELRPLSLRRGSSEMQSSPSLYDNMTEQEEQRLYSWSSCQQMPLDDLRPPASPASSSNHSAPSSGSSDVFLPSNHEEDALRDETLQQQTEDYQGRISRLQCSNDLLQCQLSALRVCLEQHKRTRSIAEARIRTCERERRAAEQQNMLLQEEMEYFLRCADCPQAVGPSGCDHTCCSQSCQQGETILSPSVLQQPDRFSHTFHS